MTRVLDVKVYGPDGTLLRIIPGAALIQRGAVKPHTMKIAAAPEQGVRGEGEGHAPR